MYYLFQIAKCNICSMHAFMLTRYNLFTTSMKAPNRFDTFLAHLAVTRTLLYRITSPIIAHLSYRITRNPLT